MKSDRGPPAGGSGPDDLDQFSLRGDGSSIEQAVGINLKLIPLGVPNGAAGVALQYEWISRRYPLAQPLEQALMAGADGRMYDQIRIRLPSGEERSA